MRPTTTNSPAGGMLGWAGTANPSDPTMSRLSGGSQDRPIAGASPLTNGGGLPGKGGGSTLQPTPGGAGGSALASLFMGNAPAVAGQTATTLPDIVQPRAPIIGMPPERRPLPPTPQTPAPLPQFRNIGDVLAFARANPGRLTPEQLQNYKRLFNSAQVWRHGTGR